MSKTEVYSWRLTPDMKRTLEAAAREEGASIGAIIEKACRAWLEHTPARTADAAEQQRLNLVLDAIIREARERDPGGPPTPSATNENVRKAIGRKLAKDRERRRAPC
jgi:hypothetical protein